jgi:hypothetical protein
MAGDDRRTEKANKLLINRLGTPAINGGSGNFHDPCTARSRQREGRCAHARSPDTDAAAMFGLDHDSFMNAQKAPVDSPLREQLIPRDPGGLPCGSEP